MSEDLRTLGDILHGGILVSTPFLPFFQCPDHYTRWHYVITLTAVEIPLLRRDMKFALSHVSTFFAEYMQATPDFTLADTLFSWSILCNIVLHYCVSSVRCSMKHLGSYFA